MDKKKTLLECIGQSNLFLKTGIQRGPRRIPIFKPGSFKAPKLEELLHAVEWADLLLPPKIAWQNPSHFSVGLTPLNEMSFFSALKRM
jgi:hypothetical protein